MELKLYQEFSIFFASTCPTVCSVNTSALPSDFNLEPALKQTLKYLKYITMQCYFLSMDFFKAVLWKDIYLTIQHSNISHCLCLYSPPASKLKWRESLFVCLPFDFLDKHSSNQLHRCIAQTGVFLRVQRSAV